MDIGRRLECRAGNFRPAAGNLGKKMSLFMKLRTYLRRFVRAVSSRNRAARFAIARAALAPVTRTLDRFLAVFVETDKTFERIPQCVFICSPPRSGSTVIYQVLSRVLKCSYVTNLHQMFPSTAQLFFKHLSGMFSSPKGLSSYYGHTAEMLNVNEGNGLADYWFKSRDPEELRMRFLRTVRWLTGDADLPVIIKNVGAYDKLATLAEAVPELVFLRINRDSKQVVESELKAFYELGYFNPMPEGLRQIDWDDPVKFSVEQIMAMEKTLDSQMGLVPSSQVINVSYESFCAQPEVEIAVLAKRIGVEPCWRNFEEKLTASCSGKVSEEDSARISELLRETGNA